MFTKPVFSLTLITTAFSVVSEAVSLACEETGFKDNGAGLGVEDPSRQKSKLYRKET